MFVRIEFKKYNSILTLSKISRTLGTLGGKIRKQIFSERSNNFSRQNSNSDFNFTRMLRCKKLTFYFFVLVRKHLNLFNWDCSNILKFLPRKRCTAVLQRKYLPCVCALSIISHLLLKLFTVNNTGRTAHCTTT